MKCKPAVSLPRATNPQFIFGSFDLDLKRLFVFFFIFFALASSSRRGYSFRSKNSISFSEIMFYSLQIIKIIVESKNYLVFII